MPPLSWIHCNICATTFTEDVKFYLLSCYHVLCKNCLTQAGCKICPLCKKSIKFEELQKLPDKLKAWFTPNIFAEFDVPWKMLEFQQNQQNNQFKLALEFESRYKKIIEMKTKLERELPALKLEAERVVHQRQKMQDKLKEIYYRKRAQPSKAQPSPRKANQTPSTEPTTSKNSDSLSGESPKADGNRLSLRRNSTLLQSGVSVSSRFFEKISPLQKFDRQIDEFVSENPKQH